MDKQKLNLLILEDNPDDAELIVRELKKEGFDFEWKRVETEKAFIKALSEKPDIILADFKLPSFDGMAAIKLQQKIAPEIPLILVSGTIGEELAVKCLRAGASDYILKDKLSRLSPVIKRSLKEVEEHKEQKKAEEALRESEEKLSNIVNGSFIATFVIDNNHKITHWNKACEKLTGFSAKEMYGTNNQWKAFYKAERPVIADLIIDNANNDEIFKYYKNKYQKSSLIEGALEAEDFFSNIGKKGKWLFFTASPLKDIQGNITGAIETLQDITERKQAEEALNKNFQQQKLLTEVSYLFTKLGKFEKNMNEVLRLLGEYTNISRVYVFEDFNNGEYTKNTYEWCNENIEPQIDNLQETTYSIVPSWKKILNEKGMVYSTDISELPQDIKVILEPQKIKSILVLPIYVKDRFFGFIGFDDCENHKVWDNSEIDLLKIVANVISTIFERRQAEEETKTKNLFLESLIQQSPLPTFVMNSKGFNVMVNEAFLKFYAVPDKEMILGRNALTEPANVKQGVVKYFKDALKGKIVETSEIEFVSPYKNKKVITRCRMFPILDQTGTLTNVVVMQEDITERKKAEKALLFEQKQFLSMFDSIDEAVYVTDPDTYELLYFNKITKSRWKGNIGDKCYKVLQNRTSPCPFCSNKHIFGKNIGKTYIWEFRNEIDKHWYRCIDKAIKWPDGRMVRYEMAIDINKSKQAKEALLESEEKYRLLAENTLDCIWKVDKELRFTYVNPSVYAMLGFTPEEWTGSTLAEHCSKEEMQRIMGMMAEEMKKENYNKTLEMLLIHKDGREIPVEIRSKILVDNNKNMIEMQGTTSDITERKQTEKKIRKLSTAVTQSPSVIAITDLKGNLEYVNPKFTELTGYTFEEAIGLNPRILKSGELSDDIYRDMWEIISSGKEWRGEFHNKKKNGKLNWEAASISPIFDEQGEIINYLKVAEDITARKKAEEESRLSKTLLRDVMDLVPVFICAKNLDGRFILINKKLTDFYDTTVEEMTGMLHADLCKDENELRAMLAADRVVIESSNPKFIPEETMKNPDGSIIVLETYKIPFTAYGEPAVLIAATDITKRKKAEEELKKTNEELSAFNRLAVGRELKMIELKSEINELLKKLGKEGKYKIVE